MQPSVDSHRIHPMPSRSNVHERNIVEWQFVFAALWSLCGQNSVKLAIPQTLLIRNGCAYKWLATDPMQGHLQRKQVGPLFIRPCSSTNQRGRSQRSRSVRKQLIDIVDSFGSGTNSDSRNSSTCIVCWYLDGRYEYITRQEFFKMALSDRWRLQLVGIQECCGNHHHHRIGRNGVNNASMGSTSTTAADILASSIASYVERSYFDECNGGRIVVVRFDADFIMDDYQNLWFSHAKKLIVRYSSIGASALVARCGITSLEVEIEAENAGEKLRRALRLALQRKVGVQTCFGHFDVENLGYVGAGGLQDGLSRLGLEISDDASGMLMCWIARADGMHFCSDDLVDFALRSELCLGDNNNEAGTGLWNRGGDASGVGVDDSKSSRNTGSRDNDDAADEQNISEIRSTASSNNENGACVPFEVDLDDHRLPNNDNAEECSVPTTCRDKKSGFFVDDDETARGCYGANACASSSDENDTPDRDNFSESQSDSASRSSTTPSGENNGEIKINPSDVAPTVPPLPYGIETGASSSPFLSSSTPTPMRTPKPQTSSPLSSPTNAESAAGLHTSRAEIHLMRQEDKLSLDAFRIVPNNFAAFQEAAKQGRERARVLRTLAKEEVILEKMLDSGSQRAIKREQRRLAGANGKESAARSELIILKETMERLKESLQLQQVLLAQHKQEEINPEEHPSSKEDVLIDREDQTTSTRNANSELSLVNNILFVISTSGQALRDIGYKQHQAQIRATEYTNEVQSAERSVKQLQEGLTAVSDGTGTRGTGNVSIATLPFATQELRIRLQRAKDKLERAAQQQHRAKKELQWCNKSVQAAIIVFRQKQWMGKDLLTWVEAEVERCRVDILQLRQQREDLGNETTLLREKSDACQRRIEAIKSEMGRFNNNTGGATSRSGTSSRRQQQGKDQNFGRQGQRWCMYFDTSLWHDDGLLQRMETKEFMRLVEKERSTLERDLAVHRFRGEEIAAELDHIKQLLSTNSIQSSKLNSTRSRLCGNPFLALPALPALPLKREEMFSTSLAGTDLASRIRGTRHDILTAEEKEWVCLDCSINPHLYECNRINSEKKTSRPGRPIIGPKIIHRLLNLPEQIQLALPYLKSTEEIRAHFLINKYTLGRGEEYFREYDTATSCGGNTCRNGGGSLTTTNGEGGPTTQSPTFTGITNNHRNLSEDYAVDLGVTSSTSLLDALAKDDKSITTSRSSDDYHDIAAAVLSVPVAMGHRQNKTTGDGNEDGYKMDTGALSPCIWIIRRID